MATESQIQEFIMSYKVCGLWATNDQTDEYGGDPLDKNYSIDDIDDETALDMEKDCRKFIEENESLLNKVGNYEQHGHDLFLTRNGHGVGFWDRGYPKEIGDTLSDAARDMGEVWLYIGPGELIYQE